MLISDAQKFETKLNDTVIVAPCVEIVLLLDTTSDLGVLDFYHRSREVLKERITHYQTGNTKGFSKLTPRAETLFPTWFSTPGKGERDYYMVLSHGDKDQQATASTIHLSIFRRPSEQITDKTRQTWANDYQKYKRQVLRGHSLLRLTLPLDHPLAKPEKLEEWMLDLALVKNSASFTGYCGLALNQFEQGGTFGSLYGRAQQTLKSLVLRHPELGWELHGMPDIIRYEPDVNEFRLLVKRANWFNIICDHTLDALGGRSAIIEQLKAHPNLSSYELKHGIAIRAGESPQLGDIDHRDFIPVYRELAAIIRPIRIPTIGWLGANFMKNDSNEWLNAFDKEID